MFIEHFLFYENICSKMDVPYCDNRSWDMKGFLGNPKHLLRNLVLGEQKCLKNQFYCVVYICSYLMTTIRFNRNNVEFVYICQIVNCATRSSGPRSAIVWPTIHKTHHKVRDLEKRKYDIHENNDEDCFQVAPSAPVTQSRTP